MAYFHNATKAELVFSIRHTRFIVPAGANVSIDDDFAWVVPARGLLLTAGLLEGAPMVQAQRLRPTRTKLPPGVELGPIKRRAREENEDPDVGDGPALEGDDLDPDEDPIERAAKQLEEQGIDVTSLGGAQEPKGRRRARQQ
jgi:hypothetical protein